MTTTKPYKVEGFKHGDRQEKRIICVNNARTCSEVMRELSGEGYAPVYASYTSDGEWWVGLLDSEVIKRAAAETPNKGT